MLERERYLGSIMFMFPISLASFTPPLAIVRQTRRLFALLSMSGLCALLFLVPVVPACKSGSVVLPPEVPKTVIRIADDVCQEIADAGASPDWVKLVCQVGSEVATVLLPRADWVAVKARTRKGGALTTDAGPGL
jgi:hypothetical protein